MSLSVCYYTTIKITSELKNVSVTAAAALSRDAFAMSHLSAESCTQRMAAGRGDRYPLAAATAAVVARSPVHIEQPST